MKVLRDVIYGEITVEDEYLPIISSSPFQRLRRIKQLGLVELIYPGATHTRFAHSLGVFHLSKYFGDKVLSLYALLHDVGHAPFSHATEEALKRLNVNFDHEKRSLKIAKEILEDSVFSFKEFKKKAKEGVIVHGDVGIDRMDYLMRDSYYTGVKVGFIPWRRLIRLIDVKDGVIEVEEKGIEAVEHFFIARFILGSSVYMHKTNLIAEGMLGKAIEYLCEEINWKEIVKMDDFELVNSLRESETKAKLIWEKIERRELYKIIYTSKEREEALEFYEKVLERNEEHLVIFGERGSWHKDVKARIKDGKSLYEISPLIRSLAEADRAKRYFFVAVDRKIKGQ